MEQETVCSHCGDSFSSKGKYNYHYRLVHQMEIKTLSTDDTESSMVRSINDKFVCVCGKNYGIYPSLHRHQLICLEWKNKHVTDGNTRQAVQGISLIYW